MKDGDFVKFGIGLSGALAAIAVCSPQPTAAQTGPQVQGEPLPATPPGVPAAVNPAAADPAAATQDGALGDIVVTAQRREQSLQRVPISITAVSAQELATRNITTTASLSQQTPNLYQTNASLSGGPVAIRGVSTFAINAGVDQAVAVYVDDIYQGTAVGSNATLFDVQRVEVLRGPQSTFFGRNSLAGAVSITTRRPDYVLRGSVEGSYGNYNAWSAKGLINLPLKDDVAALSLGILRSKRDGYDRNVFLDERVNDDARTTVRAQLRLQPSSNIDILATYEYLNAHDRRAFDPYVLNQSPSGAPFNVLSIGPVLGLNLFTVPFSADGRDRQLSSDTRARSQLRSHAASLRVDVDLDWANLLLISSYRTHRLDDLFDADLTEAQLATGINPERYKAFTQEARLSSAGGGPLSWIVGATYHHQQTRNGNGAETFPLAPAIFGAIFGAPDLPVGLSQVDGRITTDSYAAFARIDWEFADRLSLGLGGRYTHEIKRLRTSQTAAPFNDVVFGFPNVPVARNRYAYDDFSPELKLSFQATPAKLVYASVSKGFKGGGFNDDQLTAAAVASGSYLLPFKREQLWNYELGFKGSFLDRRLSIDVAAFYGDWLDRQFQTFGASASGLTSNIVKSSGDARVLGVEADVRARPLAGIEVYVSGGYNQVKQTRSVIAEISKGDVIRDNPQYNVAVGGTYTAKFENLSQLQATVGYNVIGPNVITLGGASQPGDDPQLRIANRRHGLLNARLAYTLSGERITLSVYGDNLTNNRWLSAPFTSTL